MATRLIGSFLLFGGVLLSTSALEAQLPGGIVKHDRGQSVSPVYEGYFRTDDGRTFASFGYFNKNYQEEIDVPVGSDNRITPGPEDQGQPTHFLTRRNRGVCRIASPWCGFGGRGGDGWRQCHRRSQGGGDAGEQ